MLNFKLFIMKKVLLSGFIALSMIANAQTYGFESSEGYVAGQDVAGQNGWLVYSTSYGDVNTVTSELAKTGTQSIKTVPGETGTSNFLWTPDLDPVDGVNVIEGDFYLNSEAGETWFWFSPIEFGDNGGQWINRIFIAAEINAIGYVGYNDQGALAWLAADASFERDTWNHLKAEVSFDDGEVVIYLNGEQIAVAPITATNPLTITQIGLGCDNYDGLGAIYWDNIKVNAEDLAVSDIKKGAFSVYPNPATDVLKFNSTAKVESVQIYDLSGKAVSANYADGQVNVSTLAKGVYVVKVKNVDGTTSSSKFIKK